MILQQKRNFILFTDYFKKIKFLLTNEHYKINKALLKDSSKLDETDCVLCFTAITCLSNPIIYCSKCERGAHRICLRLTKVPNEDFFCVFCSEDLRKKHKKKDKDSLCSVHREPQMTSWINDAKVKRYASGKSRVKGNFEELLVDRMLLMMKNKNYASRTEDINRILSTKLEIKFEGKLFQMSEQWVHLEVPFRVLQVMISALVKANFRGDKRLKPKLVLDLVLGRLFMDKGGKGGANQIVLNPHKNYNLEEWVYSSEYCVTKSESVKEPIKLENGVEIKEKVASQKSIKVLNAAPIAKVAEIDKNTLKDKQDKIFFSIKRGESHLVRPGFDHFPVFRCENMMILKKILEDDVHLQKCLSGDLEHMQKMNLEISGELRRVVQIFKDCTEGINIFAQNANKTSLNKPEHSLLQDSERTIMKIGEDSILAESEKRSITEHAPQLPSKLPIFEKPKNAKNKYLLDSAKGKATHSKDFIIQNIKMSKIISLNGFILDDIRQYESMMLFNHQQLESITLQLSRKIKYEVSLFVHHYEQEQGLYCKKETKPVNPFEIDEDVGRESPILKVKIKNKPLDSNPFYSNQKYKIEKKQKEDNCFYCNKSDLMLINFHNKKLHLFCLIVSGNLLDFFERPKCKLSTFVIFANLMKFNILNFLLKENWNGDLALFQKLVQSEGGAGGRIAYEFKKILVDHFELRKEMIDIGIIVFKKTIVDVHCELCYEKIGRCITSI